jgi:N utilization substance protein B
MARRSKAREVVLQMLFQGDLNPDVDSHHVREMMQERIGDDELLQFSWRLFTGVMEYRAQLDEAIQRVAENWTLHRMAPTDRNVLRLGAFELLETDTPHRVVIDEAIELARKFGTAQSPQFVNGILDQLIPEERRQQNGTAEP